MTDMYRDTTSELKIISYIVRKNYKKCDNITRDLFSIKAYRLFYDIVSGHRTTFPRDVFKDMIADRLKKPEVVNPYLIKLYKQNINNISDKNIDSMVSKLLKLSGLRIALEKTEDLISSIEKGKIEDVRQIAKQISQVGITRKKSYSGEYLKDFEERKATIKARMDKPLVGVPTGIKKFDKITGGVVRGELAILIGETGIGKSIGLENFGIYAWDLNLNVLYATIEMPKNQVQFRMDSRNTRLLYQKFRKGEFEESDLIKWENKIKAYRAKKKNYFETVSLPRGCTALDVEMEGERVQDTYGEELDLMIVDYLNIMTPNNGVNRGSARDWKSQVDIAWELKELSTDFCGVGVSCWTGNQVTDEGEGKGLLKKSHIKYGRGIGEVANIVVGLIQSQDDELEDIMKLQIMKMRDVGEMNPIVIRPNYDIMILDDETLHNRKRKFSGKK